ncbi:MAG TPA: NRDE family protein [Acidimicrobiales bacterium]|nr:NRDE family protein [Acidimicrobiales bacterium]
MCLLVMLSRVDPDAPLVVAANRDERMERPARAMTVLAEGPPRILGGYDELGGGTWLAVNERGLVAGLTNRPLDGGRDPAKRSRGELPLWLAGWPGAREAVERFVEEFSPSDYNPCWMLVGDRDSLFSLDMTADGTPVAEELPPGSYVLENSPLGTSSPKGDRVNEQVAKAATMRGDSLLQALGTILGDHTAPDGANGASGADGANGGDGADGANGGDGPALSKVTPNQDPGARSVPVARLRGLSANCVHSDGYGTRSALLCCVPRSFTAPIRVLVADGPPCTTPMVDATGLWRS